MVTGRISGNLLVLDLDVESVYKKLAAVWPELAEASTVATGKGYHIYFYPEEEVGEVSTVSFDMDGYRHHLKAEGGYVVAPPSVHSTGRQYQFVPGSPFPGRLSLERLRTVIEECGGKSSRSSVDAIARSEDWFSEYYAAIYGKGERNDAVAKVAQTLRNVTSRWGWDQYGLDWLLDWNQHHCDPPLPEREVRSIWSGTRRYAAWLPPEDARQGGGQFE